MFWADRIGKEIEERVPSTDGAPLLVRDEKTLSGRVHIGSMRGVAIHGLVSEVLSERGIKNTYRYELNDFDPFDSIPGYLDEAVFTEHLGKPLYLVPSPEPGFANYAEYFGAELQEVIKKAGFNPEYYKAYADLYAPGKMDECIRIALDRASEVRRILKEVSGSVKDETWLPISVVCESCSKMMTTRASDWDGETVAYTCDKGPDGTVPCGNTGRVSPFGGRGKLFWKVDWAAKWTVQGVDVEGAGKDHSTKGGSRDVANHVAKELYGLETPFDIPYEFFLVGGKKMSSSKGRGSSAREISELFPPEVFRLALIGKDINQQTDVDPSGDSVPRMFDWYDDLAERVREGVADDFTRLYALCQLPENQAEIPTPWQLRFGQVAFIVQMPHLVLADEAERIKGSPLSEEEKEKLEERAEYARFWLTTYAPEQFRFVLQDQPSDFAYTDAQKRAFSLLADFMEEDDRTGEEVHARLHELKTEADIKPSELFVGLYQAFLARDSGPKAGWFLSVLPREFVVRSLREAGR
ncbi:MAG: lysine--tRNA ligase [Parcubacteria bacterium C7867-004]|nr:MAG: lysine--tRNA ligase [Parcubacteria bacterium C7867-004]